MRPALAHQGILVAHDTRFFGRDFAMRAAGVLAANDIPVVRCPGPLPTPAVAYAITRRDFAGAVNVTASHNPYTWNGVKFSPAWGGPALPETTSEIERRASAWLERGRVPEALGRADAEAIGLWRERTSPRRARHERRLHPHACERLAERGATEAEVSATVEAGERFPAKFGRTAFRRNFSFGGVWRVHVYSAKQVEAFAIEEDDG